MSDNRFSCCSNSSAPIKEMISIDTTRILDSCKDRDCYENVTVFITDFGYDIIDHTSTIRTKKACIASANITIDPVQFNKGFYTVNIRFYIKLTFEACLGCGRPQEFEGIAVIDKKVVLYGSESNVNIFKSNANANDFCDCPDTVCCSKNAPNAVVEVIDPIVLCTRVVEKDDNCRCCCCCCGDVPEAVTYSIDGVLNDYSIDKERYLVVSLGIFSVVRIVRPAQYLINATEYSVPDKECVAGCDNNPCSIFHNMAFPMSEFSLSSPFPAISDKKCGC
jgi:hypothetical protein